MAWLETEEKTKTVGQTHKIQILELSDMDIIIMIINKTILLRNKMKNRLFQLGSWNCIIEWNVNSKIGVTRTKLKNSDEFYIVLEWICEPEDSLEGTI